MAWMFAERGKARALVDLLASKHDFAGGRGERTAQQRRIAEIDPELASLVSVQRRPVVRAKLAPSGQRVARRTDRHGRILDT